MISIFHFQKKNLISSWSLQRCLVSLSIFSRKSPRWSAIWRVVSFNCGWKVKSLSLSKSHFQNVSNCCFQITKITLGLANYPKFLLRSIVNKTWWNVSWCWITRSIVILLLMARLWWVPSDENLGATGSFQWIPIFNAIYFSKKERGDQNGARDWVQAHETERKENLSAFLEWKERFEIQKLKKDAN